MLTKECIRKRLTDESDYNPRYSYVLSRKDILSDYLPEVIASSMTSLEISFIATELYGILEPSNNSNIAKTHLSSIPIISKMENNNYYQTFRKKSGKSISVLEGRIDVIFGLAVATIVPKSRYIYNSGKLTDIEVEDDILIDINTKQLRRVLNHRLSLTGNVIKDIGNIFIYFWYNFPEDITGVDELIRTSSLEWGLVID